MELTHHCLQEDLADTWGVWKFSSFRWKLQQGCGCLHADPIPREGLGTSLRGLFSGAGPLSCLRSLEPISELQEVVL